MKPECINEEKKPASVCEEETAVLQVALLKFHEEEEDCCSSTSAMLEWISWGNLFEMTDVQSHQRHLQYRSSTVGAGEGVVVSVLWTAEVLDVLPNFIYMQKLFIRYLK